MGCHVAVNRDRVAPVPDLTRFGLDVQKDRLAWMDHPLRCQCETGGEWHFVRDCPGLATEEDGLCDVCREWQWEAGANTDAGR